MIGFIKEYTGNFVQGLKSQLGTGHGHARIAGTSLAQEASRRTWKLMKKGLEKVNDKVNKKKVG
jgi:hypothetical protein